MGLVDKMIDKVIDSMRNIKEPVFLKEFENENPQIKDLMELSQQVSEDKKEVIDRDILLLKQGLDGEKNVYYELKNSFIPMLCLHDIRLKYKDYLAQFDFIIITHQFIYVLETKKLNGDIEITPDGDFIRTLKRNNGRVYKKEGMYSPISQNERHVNILKQMLINNKIIKHFPIKSLVVIANPKSIINKDKCPKIIKQNIYKYDQLSKIIRKDTEDFKKDRDFAEKVMYRIGNYILEHNDPITFNYSEKYSLTMSDLTDTNKHSELPVAKKEEVEEVLVNNCSTDEILYNKLKEYRLNVSRKENIKAFIVFSNDVLSQIIKEKPKSLSELMKINGIGEKKLEKYGEDIISIINHAGTTNN